MATEIVIPKLGMGMDAITIVQWLKSVGDPIDSGEPLIEITTNKVNIEVSSLTSGVLLRQLFIDGERVSTDTVVGYIGEEGEELAGLKSRDVSSDKPDLNYPGIHRRFDDSMPPADSDRQWEQVGYYLTRREKKMYQATVRVEEKMSGLSEEVGQVDKILLRLCDFQMALIQDVKSLRHEVSQLRQQNEQLRVDLTSWATFRIQNDDEVAASIPRASEFTAGDSPNQTEPQALPDEVREESHPSEKKRGFFKRMFS